MLFVIHILSVLHPQEGQTPGYVNQGQKTKGPHYLFKLTIIMPVLQI